MPVLLPVRYVSTMWNIIFNGPYIFRRILGGVVGGIAALVVIILLLFFCRRRRSQRRSQGNRKERTDLFNDNDEPTEHLNPEDDRLHPVPFVLPPVSSDAGGGSEHVAMGRLSDEPTRRLSTIKGSSVWRPSTPGGSTTISSTNATRKTANPPSLRPVNIIQHDDAGSAAGDAEEEAETVELPPAYTNIRRDS